MANGFPPSIVVIDAGDRLLLLDRPANDAEYEVYRLPRKAFADDGLERAELFRQASLPGELATSDLEFDESRQGRAVPMAQKRRLRSEPEGARFG
jgi:hypothetical protein